MRQSQDRQTLSLNIVQCSMIFLLSCCLMHTTLPSDFLFSHKTKSQKGHQNHTCLFNLKRQFSVGTCICSFSLNPEFSQKIDNPPALIIIFPMEEYIYTPSVSEYIFKRISHAETFSTGMNDYKYKPVPSVGYKVERDLLSESFIYKRFPKSQNALPRKVELERSKSGKTPTNP